jgi:MOSC domain-containing protein YiiM
VNAPATAPPHRTRAELAAGLDHVRLAPRDHGRLELIVARPSPGVRVVLSLAELTREDGLVGDSWRTRRKPRARHVAPDPDKQLTLMNARAAALVAGDDRALWALAGDQLYVDFDLGLERLPPGTLLVVGTAVIQLSPAPHTGCRKFTARFGSAATRLFNSPEGRALRLRGVNARVVTPGTARPGDAVTLAAA